MNYVFNSRKTFLGIITGFTYLTVLLVALGCPSGMLIGCAIVLGGVMPVVGLWLFKVKNR